MDNKAIKLIADELKELKRKIEVGDLLFSIDDGIALVKEETGIKAGYPYIAQINTYLYIYRAHFLEIKVDIDSNKVLSQKHIDFVKD